MALRGPQSIYLRNIADQLELTIGRNRPGKLTLHTR